MNKIYRVIWSRAKHCYVVVSEMAKSRTKSNGSGSRGIRRTALTALVLAGLSLSLGSQSLAADPIVINSDNVTVNTVSGADNSTIIGDENTVTNSKSQVVIGDKNIVQDRNQGTVSGKQETRTDTVMDILIGKGNKITGNDTYMTGNESLTIIGNNNRLGNPTSAIIIGDNQYIFGSKSIVIGSLAQPYTGEASAGANVILGYDTLSEGGGSVLLGNSSYVGGMFQTVSGFNSIIEGGNQRMSAEFATIYGAFNRSRYGFDDSTDNSGIDGTANSVVGTFNDTKNASGTLILGSGNDVTNSVGAGDVGNLSNIAFGLAMDSTNMSAGKALDYDTVRNTALDALKYTGGSTVVFGNANQSDYSNLSQIIGTGNIIKGSSDSISAYNMMSGYENTGTNIKRTAIVGTGNIVTNSEDNVILGDYHQMSGGNHNVILGSRDYTETKETITYSSPYYPLFDAEYEVTKRTPTSKHTDNIENAVMLGYNTDVTQSGGVALGAEAVASTAAGKAGYDPATKDASTDTTGTWKSTLAAVSVGDSTDSANVKTRQITNVAAGSADTDAVNVAQLKKVQTQLDSNSVHYFSTKSSQTSTGTNYANDGATGTDSIVIGISSKSSGNNSTVLGNNVSVVGDKNNFNSSIVVGQNIDVDGTHNAVFATDYENGDYKTTKVFGEQNTVLGVGNLVGYTAVQNGNSWTYTKNDYGSDQNVAVGLLNTVSGGSIAVGTSSHVNTLGTSFGHGNSIEGSMLEGGQLRIALGNYLTVKGEMGLAVGNSAKVDGDWAIAIGNNNRDETTTMAQGAYAIALGTNAKATNTSALALGTSSVVSGFYATALGTAAKATVTQGVALGSFSTADRVGGIFGYDPLTKKESTSNTAAWKSVLGAVSVGGQVNYSDGTTGQATRQITNVAAGSADTDAVNVAQLKQVQQSISDAVKEGKTTIEAGDNITVEKGSTENSYKITAKDTTLKDSDSALSLNGNKLKLEIEDTSGNKVSGSVELDKIGSAIDTKNTISKGKHIDYTEKTNDYGGTEYTLDVVTDGKVESGNTGIVTGDTVYQETRVAKDGEYVKQANSAAENLSVLDSQVKTNTESITNISNNVTNLNSRVSNLDTRINRVGAGSAALAALHPQDYDPSAKWDFAAGYGNYKSANAVAIGAFYRPTNDVLFSIGTSMGGGENMFNAGVSVKFGSSNEYSNYSKASLAAVVSEQSKQLEAQHSTIEALQTKVEKQEQENQELRAQVQEIMRQLSAQR